MTPTDPPGEIESPCVQVCILDEAIGHCIGCGRTRAELWRWTRCAEAEKLEIVKAAAARMAALKP